MYTEGIAEAPGGGNFLPGVSPIVLADMRTPCYTVVMSATYDIRYTTKNFATGELRDHEETGLFLWEADKRYDAILAYRDLVAISPRP